MPSHVEQFFSNIHLAAYLISQGCPLAQLKAEGGQFRFGFTPSETLNDKVLEFVNGRASLNVSEFNAAVNRLKTLMNAAREGDRRD